MTTVEYIRQQTAELRQAAITLLLINDPDTATVCAQIAAAADRIDNRLKDMDFMETINNLGGR